jgi:hypothetical protein
MYDSVHCGDSDVYEVMNVYRFFRRPKQPVHTLLPGRRLKDLYVHVETFVSGLVSDVYGWSWAGWFHDYMYVLNDYGTFLLTP